MDCYEITVGIANFLGFEVIEKRFRSSAKGLCKGHKIGISKDLDTIEKRCILAEEVSHGLYTVGNILDQNDLQNKKQEYFARKKALEFLVPLSEIVRAYNAGIQEPHEMAEYLEVTEQILTDALALHERKCGPCTFLDGQIVRFSPFMVCSQPHMSA